MITTITWVIVSSIPFIRYAHYWSLWSPLLPR
jgi:hypothetical protein